MLKERAPRQKTFLRGFVYFGDGLPAVECLVREMSDAGARIKFCVPPPVIDNIELTIPIKNQNVTAKVIWRGGNEIGIAFARPADVKSDAYLSIRLARLEDEIAALKQLIKLLQKPSERNAEEAA